jgi:O-antigen/teichoic acid export membrane protein
MLLQFDAAIAAAALFLGGALAVLAMVPGFIATARPSLAGALSRLRALNSWSLRAAPAGMVTALALYADRLVLLPLLPAAELGLYAVAYSFSRLIQFVQPALQSIFLSHLSGQDAAGAKLAHDHAVRFLLVALAAGCGVLWLTGGWLLGFMYGGAFVEAVGAFRILVIEASFGVLAQLTLQLYMANDRPGFASGVQSATLVVSLVLLLALVPERGGQGAAIALAIAGGLRWLALLFALRPVLGLTRPRLWLTRADWRYFMSRLR